MSALDTGQIMVADRPPELFAYPHPDHTRLMRTFRPYIETLRSDAEAWDALFADPHNLVIALAVYGKAGLLTRRRDRQLSFDGPGLSPEG